MNQHQPRLFKRSALFFVTLALFAACRCSGSGSDSSDSDDTDESTDPKVTVVASQGSFAVTVEIADDPTERATGLMNRLELAEDHGMLFIWDADSTDSFWMKNTYISLDILFIDQNGMIVTIKEDATPLSTELITPTQSYRYVLEVNAGFTDSTGATVGNSVQFDL